MIPRPGKVGERRFLECEVQALMQLIRLKVDPKEAVRLMHPLETEAECWELVERLRSMDTYTAIN